LHSILAENLAEIQGLWWCVRSCGFRSNFWRKFWWKFKDFDGVLGHADLEVILDGNLIRQKFDEKSRI